MKNSILRARACSIALFSIGVSGLVSCSSDQSDLLSANAEQPAVYAAGGDADEVLARKDGYVLTEAHFQEALQIEMAMEDESYYPIADQLALKAGILEMFYDDPAGLLEELEKYSQLLGVSQEGGPRPASPSTQAAPRVSGQGVAQGHLQLRQSVEALNQRNGGTASFTDQSFDTPSVNQLRTFMANSQMVHKVSSEYYSGTTVYTFCSDGTFRYSQNSGMSVSSTSPGSGGYETGNVFAQDQGVAQGYWDAYSEGGVDAILIYSADAAFASESMNNTGLLPFLVAQYQSDVIQVGPRGVPATPDNLIRRQAISGC
jgi:hypothetical protein